MPEFWSTYDASRSLPDHSQRALIIKSRFFDPLRKDAYSGSNFNYVDIAHIVRWLADFDGLSDDVRSLSTEVPTAWARHQASFKAALPDFKDTFAVYTLISLFKFDGQVHSIAGRPALFVGLDGVVKYHGKSADLAVLLDHESFHLYHSQVNSSFLRSSSPPLGAAVWMEGLATYASEALNPQATRLAVLLDDQSLATASPDTISKIAAGLIPQLNSTDAGQQMRFLQYGYESDLPARGGYLVGLMLAERLGRTRTLQELARLPMRSVFPLMQEELSMIAEGPTSRPDLPVMPKF